MACKFADGKNRDAPGKLSGCAAASCGFQLTGGNGARFCAKSPLFETGGSSGWKSSAVAGTRSARPKETNSPAAVRTD